MHSILKEIYNHKLIEIATAKKNISFEELEVQLANFVDNDCISFKNAILAPGINLIAEIKKATPSKGILRENFDVVEITKTYVESGVAAISVITDERFFHGSIENLKIAREHSNIPIIRKDFFIDKYQILEAKLVGANAILLIVGMFEGKFEKLKELFDYAKSLELDVLVETSTELEMKTANKLEADIIGINSRDLNTFKTNLSIFKSLAPLARAEAILVAESGIHTKSDLKFVQNAGANGVLVGTSLMQSKDISQKIKKLLNTNPELKICGITNEKDYKFVVDSGTDYAGFIVSEGFSRTVKKELIQHILKNSDHKKTKNVGVFVNEAISQVKAFIKNTKIDVVQLHGNESPEYCAKLKRLITVWKVFKPSGNLDLDIKEILQFKDKIDVALIDASSAADKASQKTQLFNAFDLVQRLQSERIQVGVAGGINIKNIKTILAKITPDLIDISSGVESKVRIKSKEKILTFQKILRNLS